MSERSVSKQRDGKRWYDLIAPEQFDRTELGSTFADEPDKVYGRTVEVTLGDITGDQGENNTKLTFKVNDVSSDAAYTEFVKHELARDYVRSLVRRGASKVDVAITVLTTDDYRVQLQPVAFTTKKADHSQERAIRRLMIDMVRDAAKERTFEELIDSVVEGRLSSAIYAEAKEIYPLRRAEIMKTTLEASPEEIEAEEEASVAVDSEDVAVDEE